MGRNRLPPEEMRWFATSGIIATSDPVRERITWLTRARSGATSPERLERPGSLPLSSREMTTPTSNVLMLDIAAQLTGAGCAGQA
jgi:hypothetical protein